MSPASDPARTRSARLRRNDEAVDAWQRARAALAAQDAPAARFWLERVCRIAPDDGRPQYELACLLAALNDPGADAAIEAVATRHRHAEAWLLLARLRRRHRAPQAAAAALAALLERHEAPETADDVTPFAPLATAIARDAGRPGWCGIADGRLVGDIDGTTMIADGSRLAASPRGLAAISRLDILRDGMPLLGSPLDLAAINRHEGLVTAAKSGIEGWVMHPAAPWRTPRITLVDRDGARRVIRLRRVLDPAPERPLTPRHSFRVTSASLRGLVPPFRIETVSGQTLNGAPIDPAALEALRPARARNRHPVLPPRAPLCAVMPAYRDAEATRDAINSFAPDGRGPCPLIVVDDAAPEPALVRLLDEQAASGRIHLVRHRANRGFPAAVNTGIATARRRVPGCDILLLNADILLPPGAPRRLQDALYKGDDIASATPLSNEATIMSYPLPSGGNPPPDAAATAALDALARRVGRGTLIDIPTAIGFCMAIRHDALDATGRFDSALFAQGYGEENDWCRRAALRGFRHVGVPSIFVAHRGGASFGPGGSALCARNLDLLERRHPGYRAAIEAFHRADPLRKLRRRLDSTRFAASSGYDGAVVLVTHDHGGGIARIIAARIRELRGTGQRPILLKPDLLRPDGTILDIGPTRVGDDTEDAYPNLVFDLRREMVGLLALLRGQNVRHVEFHHVLGHDPAIHSLPARLDVPAEHVVHDYAHICKRVNLIGPARRYCGEPNLAGCTACIAEAGSELTDPISPAGLLARTKRLFAAARRVTTPSNDAAARLRRHIPGLTIEATPWEDDTSLPPPLPPPEPGKPRLVALVGGVGPAKGYDILLACARDAAARDLKLTFVLIGASEADDALLETGRVRITGPFPEGEAAALLRRTGAAIGFLPSIWPETWCFALGELWRGGLHVIGFDIGAQAARIRASGWGTVLPLGLSPARINATLLAWRPDLSNLGAAVTTRSPLPARPANPT